MNANTTNYVVRFRCEDGGEDQITIEAESDDAARETAEERLIDWVSGGDWGRGGARVNAGWVLLSSEDGKEIDRENIVVEIEPDHDYLIGQAGGDTTCDHEFIATAGQDGGCDTNPGVQSMGGTTMSFRSHCRHCGLVRREVVYGSQRNPGEPDIVEYSLPKSEA